MDTIYPSEFERRVLSALIEGDSEKDILAQQLASATVSRREYTGTGMYTQLAVAPATPKLQKIARYIDEKPKIHLSHPALLAGAGAILWLHDGHVVTLECFTYEEPWPIDETLFSVSQ